MKTRLLISAVIFVLPVYLFSQTAYKDEEHLFNPKNKKDKDYVYKSYKKAESLDKKDDIAIFVFDLLTEERYSDQKYGIFTVDSWVTSTTTHFLLVENGKFKFVNNKTSLEDLEEVIKFFRRNPQYSFKEAKQYIQKTLDIIEDNIIISDSHQLNIEEIMKEPKTNEGK